MATSGGQSIQDRLNAARLSLAGQGLAKSVCKATTEEIIGPKKKHLDYLVHCTAEPNVSIPQLANLLIERTQSTSWVVVFKALVSVHHLMCYGNERFTQYLASSNCTFHLHNFIDKANVSGYDMSTFVRRYSKYLNEKALSYRTQAFDFCKVKRGVEGVLRTMHAEKLVKGLPVLQNQMDALLEFDCTTSELTNGIINAAFMLLFRDLIRLFACYNDGIINLLEKYFDMNKKMCREALDIYKKFLIRMDKVAEFLKVAESVGIDKGEIPDLAKAPGSLLEALEQHLASLEGKKTSGAVTPTQPNNKPVSALVLPNSVKSAVIALSSTSNAFGTAASVNVTSESNGFNIEETVKKTILEEEQAALNFHKERRLKELGESPTESAISSNNPFLSSPGNTIKPIGGDVIDFFGSATGTPATTPAATSSKASDDLLCLSSNPFTGTVTDGAHQNGRPAFGNNAFWGAQNGAATPSTTFVSSSNFDAVFGGSSAATGRNGGFNAPPSAIPAFDAFGDILQPQHIGSQTLATPLGSEIPPPATSSQSKSQAKVLSGDLDTSLANLAQNLDINRGGAQVKSSQMWNSPRNTSKTGGANWSPQVAPSTTPAGPAWNSPQHLQHPFNTPMAPGPMMVLGYPNQQPFVQAGARPVQSGMPVMGVGMSSSMFPVTQTAPPMVPAGQQSAFDPFGQL